MTQKQLIKHISQDTNIDLNDVKKVIKSFIETIKESLTKEEPVKIQKFGTFKVEKRKPRTAILKGKTYKIPERKVPTVSFSDEVRKACAK